jgi:hypothetical protein
VKYVSEKPKSGSLRTFCNDELMRNVEKLMNVRMLKKDGERDGREVNKDLGGLAGDEEGAEGGWHDDNTEGEVAPEQMSSRV